MRRKIIIPFFIILGTVLFFSCLSFAESQPVERAEFAKVKIYYLRWHTKTEVALTPEMVRKNPDIETTVDDDPYTISLLVKFLDLPALTKTERAGDARLVIDLYRLDGTITSYYASRDRLYNIDSTLSREIDEKFRDVFDYFKGPTAAETEFIKATVYYCGWDVLTRARLTHEMVRKNAKIQTIINDVPYLMPRFIRVLGLLELKESVDTGDPRLVIDLYKRDGSITSYYASYHRLYNIDSTLSRDISEDFRNVFDYFNKTKLFGMVPQIWYYSQAQKLLAGDWDWTLPQLDATFYDKELIQRCINDYKIAEPARDSKFLQAYTSKDNQTWYFEFEGVFEGKPVKDQHVIYVYSVKDKKFTYEFRIPIKLFGIIPRLDNNLPEVEEFIKDYWGGKLQTLDSKAYDKQLIQTCRDDKNKCSSSVEYNMKFLQAYTSKDNRFWYFEFDGLWAKDIKIVYVYSVKDKKFIGKFNISMA